MSFSVLATIIGFIVDSISIIQMLKNKQKESEKETNYTTPAILMIIGTIAIIFGIVGITTNTKSIEAPESSVGKASVSSQKIQNNTSNTYNSAELNVSEIHEAVQEKTGKVWIEDVQVLAYDGGKWGSYSFEPTVLTNTGESMSHSLLIHEEGYDNTQTLELYLNNQYNNFCATLALSDETKNMKNVANISIFADNEKVKSFKVSAGFIPESFQIDVSDVIVLKIQIDNIYYDVSKIAFGDAYFTIK